MSTAPAEDPRGGEAPDLMAALRRSLERPPPAAGRGDTDSGGERTVLVEAARGWILRHSSKPDGDRWRDNPKHLDWAAENLLCDLAPWLAARPAGDRAQPTEEVREAIARTLSETVLRLRFSDDDAPWPSEDDVSALADALLAGPLAALLDAQAAVERVEALLERRGIWPTPIKDELHRALGGTT